MVRETARGGRDAPPRRRPAFPANAAAGVCRARGEEKGRCFGLRSRTSGRGSGCAGFSLLEVMVSASLVLVVFFGLAQFYTRGRTQVDYEEDRRKATAVAQARLEGLRRDFRYDELGTLHGTDTTYVVEGRSYIVSHFVVADQPEVNAATCSLTVTWSANVGGSAVDRTLEATTMLGRGLP